MTLSIDIYIYICQLRYFTSTGSHSTQVYTPKNLCFSFFKEICSNYPLNIVNEILNYLMDHIKSFSPSPLMFFPKFFRRIYSRLTKSLKYISFLWVIGTRREGSYFCLMIEPLNKSILYHISQSKTLKV